MSTITTLHTDEEIVERIIRFLNGIGIQIVEEPLGDDTFLPGLQLKGNGIVMDRTKLKYPGDLLHEAGHIAVTEAALRPLIGTTEMDESWPSVGDEIATILWSYAALTHLNIAPKVVFHPDGYKGSSEWFVEQFTSKTYMGLPLLVWMGFCEEHEFPTMKKWVR